MEVIRCVGFNTSFNFTNFVFGGGVLDHVFAVVIIVSGLIIPIRFNLPKQQWA